MIFLSSIIIVSQCMIIFARGEWNAGCGEPGYPSNGTRNVERNHKPKSIYLCNKGFYLVGSSVRDCDVNAGAWSPAIPKCVKNLATNEIGKTQSPFLNTHLDDDVSTCHHQIGQLYGQLYINLKSVREVTEVHLEVKAHSASNIYVYATNNSFNLFSTNSKAAVCAFHAVQTTSSFKCTHLNIKTKFLVLKSSEITTVCEVIALNTNEIVQCGQPDQPLHGKIVDYNSTIAIFECDQRYTMKGPESVQCVNGAWEHKSPLCFQNVATRTKIITTSAEFKPKDTIDEDNHNVVRNNFVVGIAIGVTSVCILMLGLYFVKQCFLNRKSMDERPINQPSSMSRFSDPSNAYAQLYGSVGEGEYTYPQTHCHGDNVCLRRNELNMAEQTETDYLCPIQHHNLSNNIMKETYDKTSKK